MPRFTWSRKRPASLGSSIPGRRYRVAAFATVAGLCGAALVLVGPSQAVLIAIVLCAPAVALVVPELFGFWEWLAGKAEQHAVRRDERIYRFGYTGIRMLMVDGNPRFAAADVGSALGIAEIGEETRLFDAAHGGFVGDELYLSAAGVAMLTGLSRHPDARSFRIWFEREVMFPFNRAREGRERERKQ